MINLIKNELIKVFSKKSFYVILIIFTLFSFLISLISTQSESYDYYLDKDAYITEFHMYEDEINVSIDPMNVKAHLASMKLVLKYGLGSWQRYIIEQDMSDIIYNKELVLAGETDGLDIASVNASYNKYIEMFDKDDWKYFVNLKLDEINNKISIFGSSPQTDLATLMNEKEGLELRLKNNIDYSYGYRNSAIENYVGLKNEEIMNKNNVGNIQDKYAFEKELQNIEENIALNKYTIDTDTDITKTDDINYSLKCFMDNYGIFILILVIAISGSIVSEEFNKGTIKLLLIRPYTRIQILLSKFITTLIILALGIISMFIINFIISGIFYGFNGLGTIIPVYNFNTHEIMEMGILRYVLLTICAVLPRIILLSTLAFALSTIINNTTIAVIIALLGDVAAGIINSLAIGYNISLMKYFVSLNWSVGEMFYGRLPSFKYISLGFSYIVCLVYLVIMIIMSLYIFKKKDIKNI